MTQTSATGRKNGYSLVEVVVALLLITTCYLVITRGLVNVITMKNRCEEMARFHLNAEESINSGLSTSEFLSFQTNRSGPNPFYEIRPKPQAGRTRYLLVLNEDQ